MSILKCTCKHEFQDKTYGKDMRVHNRTKDGKARCTVCNQVKEGVKEDKKK